MRNDDNVSASDASIRYFSLRTDISGHRRSRLMCRSSPGSSAGATGLKDREDIPLRLNISCEYLPERANAFGISPSSSMI